MSVEGQGQRRVVEGIQVSPETQSAGAKRSVPLNSGGPCVGNPQAMRLSALTLLRVSVRQEAKTAH